MYFTASNGLFLLWSWIKDYEPWNPFQKLWWYFTFYHPDCCFPYFSIWTRSYSWTIELFMDYLRSFFSLERWQFQIILLSILFNCCIEIKFYNRQLFKDTIEEVLSFYVWLLLHIVQIVMLWTISIFRRPFLNSECHCSFGTLFIARWKT